MNIDLIKEFSSYVVAALNEKVQTDAYLLCHGFPADKTAINYDLLEAIAQQKAKDVFQINYRGLGKNVSGPFSFKFSIEETITLAKEILKFRPYKRLNLIGHSWGAVVVSGVVLAIGSTYVGKVFYLSPLIKFKATENPMKSTVETSVQSNRKLFGEVPLSTIFLELEEIEKNQLPYNFAHKIASQAKEIFIIQALKDDTIDPQNIQDFISNLGKKAQLIKLDLDHSFLENRQELIRTVLSKI